MGKIDEIWKEWKPILQKDQYFNVDLIANDLNTPKGNSFEYLYDVIDVVTLDLEKDEMICLLKGTFPPIDYRESGVIDSVFDWREYGGGWKTDQLNKMNLEELVQLYKFVKKRNNG